mmetsp:Transcript_16871/g.39219  ORF Transcript_16871/g.39219 Transcript_16871/m.39219 type:complete len:262 (-) Transcript_16871:865-1650(-)
MPTPRSGHRCLGRLCRCSTGRAGNPSGSRHPQLRVRYACQVQGSSASAPCRERPRCMQRKCISMLPRRQVLHNLQEHRNINFLECLLPVVAKPSAAYGQLPCPGSNFRGYQLDQHLHILACPELQILRRYIQRSQIIRLQLDASQIERSVVEHDPEVLSTASYHRGAHIYEWSLILLPGPVGRQPGELVQELPTSTIEHWINPSVFSQQIYIPLWLRTQLCRARLLCKVCFVAELPEVCVPICVVQVQANLLGVCENQVLC